jgi:hypothetical protein
VLLSLLNSHHRNWRTTLKSITLHINYSPHMIVMAILPSSQPWGNIRKGDDDFQACSYVTGFLFTPDHRTFRKARNHDGTPSAKTIPSNISVSCIPTAVILQHLSPNTHRHKSTRLVHLLSHSLWLYLVTSSLICLVPHLQFPRPPSPRSLLSL